MKNNNRREYANRYKPLIDTNREPLPLEKHPKALDFSKAIGGTIYTVKSRFNRNANESLLAIVMRWIDND